MESDISEVIYKKVDKILDFLATNDIVVEHESVLDHEILKIVRADDRYALGEITYKMGNGLTCSSNDLKENAVGIPNFNPGFKSPLSSIMLWTAGNYLDDRLLELRNAFKKIKEKYS